MKNKKLPYFFSLILVFLYTKSAYASQTHDPGAVYVQLCYFRNLFCGKTAYALIMAGLVGVGFVIFIGKANFTFAIIFCFGVCLFIAAEHMAAYIFIPPMGSHVLEACDCPNGLFTNIYDSI